jgi:AsmA protein
MKGILKIFLGIVIAVIVLMVLAAVLLPIIYDKEDLEKAIADRVSEQTGRDLTIDGGLDFSVFPWLALEVSDLSLSNAVGFGDEPFARIGQARVGVALMPLFRKQLAVDEITLEGLDLRLAVNQQGRNNWDDLTDSETGSAPPAEDSSGLFSSQRIAGLNIRDANVEYQDLQTGSHYRLGDFSMHTGPLGEDRPLPLELTALLEDLAAGTSAGIGMSATADIDLEAGKYSLEAGTFTIQLDAVEVAGTFSASNVTGDPAVSGTLAVAEFSPAELMRKLQLDPPLTADPDALQRAVLNTSFSGNPSELTLADFELELDQSTISGEMSIRDFEQPKIAFEFAVDAIDLDRYLEPASRETETAEATIPNEELKDRSVEGSLRIGTLRVAGLEFNDAEVGITIRDRTLHVHPLTARFYDGSYNGNVMLDSSGSTPVLSLDEKVDSITFQRMVSDLVDHESLSGVAQGHLRVTGRGASSGEMVGSLNGDLGLTLSEGALEGINIWYEIRRAYALYKGLAAPPAEPSRTVFSRMRLSAGVDKGVVRTRELIGELPFLTVSGDGTVDLGQSDVDLSLVATVRNAPELSNDPLSAGLRGKRVPFKVSGPLDDPGISIDWEELLKEEAAVMLLDRLGLKPGTSEETDQQESMDVDQVEEIAKGALFDLLRGKDKDKDKKDKDDDS